MIKPRDCPFCNLRGRILEEKKFCNIIFSNPRLMPGHILVTPKKHVEKLSELNNEEKMDLLNAVIEYEEKVLKFSEGYTIHNNYMPFLEQSRTKVDHLHIHIWPRNNKDEIYEKMLVYQHDLFHDLPEEDVDKYVTLLNS
ncbi:MAG: HIT family protein [Candidatus Woesearchaeota archaeon]